MGSVQWKLAFADSAGAGLENYVLAHKGAVLVLPCISRIAFEFASLANM